MRAFIRILVLLGGFFLAAVILFAVIHRDRRPRIYFAAESGDTNALAHYLSMGSNVNAAVVCYIYGHRTATLLHVAVSSGQADAVEFLLARGANSNVPDSSGNTPLMSVIGRGEHGDSLRVMQELLRGGADPNLRDFSSYGWTPLIHATVLDCTNMIRVLVDAGGDVNAPAADGSRPLHFVDHAEVARCLLDAGADPEITFTYISPGGLTNTMTPADVALREHRLDVLAVLTNTTRRTIKH